jgi:hypothetical protein
VDTDITPLLAHPDRQRSRKLLETCLREINYLMTPQTLPTDQPTIPDWHSPQQRPQHQQQIPVHQTQWAPKIPTSAFIAPQPIPLLHTDSKEVSYVTVESDAFRIQEDEELPRKLPKKVSLATPPPEPSTQTPRSEDGNNWDFSSDPKIATILERPNNNHPRQSAKRVFERKSSHHDGSPRIFNHIHTLRSHLSPVRALIAANSAATHPEETCFVTGGDDSLVKFWRVGRNASPHLHKKRGNFDVLPQITFRGHAGMVTCLAESAGTIWSGGSDGGIRGWKAPPTTRDSYGSSGTTPLVFFPLIPSFYTHMHSYTALVVQEADRWGDSRCECDDSIGGTFKLSLESCVSIDSTTSARKRSSRRHRKNLGFKTS